MKLRNLWGKHNNIWFYKCSPYSQVNYKTYGIVEFHWQTQQLLYKNIKL